MRPADLAKQLGISTSSLRNYETRGLVPPAKRGPMDIGVYSRACCLFFMHHCHVSRVRHGTYFVCPCLASTKTAW
ncbi:MerR family DNA-binding transcriptional regulator [Brevibacillus choshinensis]|uniref:MerR family DNA-binding transcriptional regulator n=1 Tax=Brevibacillus choshinensis TaxID=54911 RepID=A0ABX7FVS4_BRECH|nr:MerR family DNA-binding transcriptional regulator [Brevibacillus choshinensis]